ncbi:hypothetical protein QF035_002986 [Streptomyces umbrinus]|uniref:GntR family transcriptional regulator n=1 Tax=Streptomyces umbrinus TaxID=67370 RepID=A0ABU0SSA6_9ACTN|nr:hypothetical protein [Streptomyces umbrinus]
MPRHAGAERVMREHVRRSHQAVTAGMDERRNQ